MAALFDALPKTELHLHLEGTVAPETLWQIARRNAVSLPVGTLAELRALYDFKGFDTFLTLWLAMCRCFRTPADYEQMADAFVADCGRQNIRYVEAHFTPYNHERFGFGGRRALDIVTRRLEEQERAGGPVVRLILDIPSESVPESGPYTAALLEEIANPLVVAIGLGGPEDGFPRTLAAPYFERARRAGYAAVAHAGETGGAEHVRQAVVELGVRRVQHGVRAVDDHAVVRLLAERGVCCDVALTSNTFLTPYRDLATHPIRALMAAGVPVTLSTDDPPFFGTDLCREYERARTEAGLTAAELWQIDLNGLRYGLAATDLRRRLLIEFEAAGRAAGLDPQPGATIGAADSQ
ncbi:MAG: adenosine deaminase [Vicinamibacteria bacterium]